MENQKYYLFFVVVAGILPLLLFKKVNALKQKAFRDLLNLKEKARFKKYLNYIDIYNAISTESKFQDNNEILEDFFSRQIFYIERIKRFWRNDIIRLHTSDFKKRKNYKVKFRGIGLFGGLNYLSHENIKNIDEVSSMIFFGQSGSGKSYSLKLIYEAWKKNHKTFLTVVDTKTKDLEDESDYFTSLETDEEYKQLIKHLSHIRREADKKNFKNQKLNCSYFFIFDECIDYLSKSPSDSKERALLKLELVELITHFVRKISRSQNCPVLFGSQNFSFGSLLLNPSYISKIFISRLKNSQQCNTFGVPVLLGLSENLKNGRWIDTTDNQIVQFPVSLRK